MARQALQAEAEQLREQLRAIEEQLEQPPRWPGGRPAVPGEGYNLGHYHEAAMSRVEADRARMQEDGYRAEVADRVRQHDTNDGGDAARAAGLTLEPLSPGIGTLIHGVDLAAPTDAQIAVIQATFLDRKVIFFRNQGHISREQHIAFGRRFADIGLAFGEQAALSANTSPDEYPEILPLYADEDSAFVPSNWHSDVTWSDRPPLGSILLSRKSPPVGGDTLFLDSYAHWDGLPPALKELLEGRRAAHGRGARTGSGNEVEHPIARTHPITGKTALYINPTFTQSICGMEEAESARLLSQLYSRMYATPEYGCRFQWEDGSVAMWCVRKSAAAPGCSGAVVG